MPQEFHVVKCYSCGTFQVQIVKKINKFDCKMCGEKQSVKKEYGKGTGKDCRLHVQKLNSLRIENESQMKQNIESCEFEEIVNEFETDDENAQAEQTNSKWSEYLVREEADIEEENDTELINFTFVRPNKRNGTRAKRSEPEKQSLVENKTNLNASKHNLYNSYLDEELENTKAEKNNFKLVTERYDAENECSSKKPNTVNFKSKVNLKILTDVPSKKSKWEGYITEENLQEINKEMDLNNTSVTDQITCNQKIRKDVFKIDDENLDEILNF